MGLASNFQVVGNCSVLQLTANGGHGTTIYTGPVPLAPNGCTVSPFTSAIHYHRRIPQASLHSLAALRAPLPMH